MIALQLLRLRRGEAKVYDIKRRGLLAALVVVVNELAPERGLTIGYAGKNKIRVRRMEGVSP